MHIVLIGYMGSGKSFIGTLLAQKLRNPFKDMDHYIAQQEQMSIPELFRSKGEIYFRKKETFYLKKLFELKEKTIVALGGGTPCYSNNMELILSQTPHVFYLKTSVDVLVERLEKEQEQRPLIKDIKKTALPEFIRKHLFERNFFYMQAPNIISTDQRSLDEIIAEIIKKL